MPVRDESGFTLIEMLIAMALMVIVIAGVVNMLVSGTRAGANSNARIEAQQNARLAIDRLEFEGHCASGASLINAGQGVSFSLPTYCSHASGQATWCVVSGGLVRYASNSCTGSGQTYVTDVTSGTPFTLPAAASGDLPVLQVALTFDPSSNAATAASLDDLITLRNAARAS